jgi:ketosteroid isomerase-like protein
VGFEESVSVSREAWRRFNSGDLQGTVDLIHPEAEFQDFPGVDAGEWNYGREGGIAFGAKLQQAFDDFKVYPLEFYEFDSEQVISFGMATGRGKRSGIRAELEWAALIRVRDGMAQRIELWKNRDELLTALELNEDDLLDRRRMEVDPTDIGYPPIVGS